MFKNVTNIILADDSNMHVLYNLAQGYEAEFSNLTKDMPDADGKFKMHSYPAEQYVSYLCYKDVHPVGFAVLDLISNKAFDIYEFYIVPAVRKQNIGKELAFYLFDTHQGDWQVRQIEGADHSTCFWRRVIEEYTNGNYKEDVIPDPKWNNFLVQTFTSNNLDSVEA